MLQIRHLTIRHKKDYRVLLEDFNLCVNPGDKCALIGEEGNGKSTLLKLIYAPDMAEAYAEYEGEIQRSGERFGYLPQELPETQRQRTIYEYLTAADRFYDKDPLLPGAPLLRGASGHPLRRREDQSPAHPPAGRRADDAPARRTVKRP